MPGLTRVCFQCKQSFLKEDMIQYASLRAKQQHWYCKKCYEEKIAKDNFTDAVCKIFGIKMPGARIWADRERLINKYGYTDKLIVECLDYLYNVKNMKKISESLYLINPLTVEELMKYKRNKEFEARYLANAMQEMESEKQKEYIIPTPKKKKQMKKIEYDPDEWLDD